MPIINLDDYFKDKPASYSIYKVLADRIANVGKAEIDIKSQISFKAKRKFAWIWLYNVTAKNPQGTVQIMLATGNEHEDGPVYRTAQMSNTRWNHLVVVHSLQEAKDPRLNAIIQHAFTYGNG